MRKRAIAIVRWGLAGFLIALGLIGTNLAAYLINQIPALKDLAIAKQWAEKSDILPHHNL